MALPWHERVFITLLRDSQIRSMYHRLQLEDIENGYKCLSLKVRFDNRKDDQHQVWKGAQQLRWSFGNKW